MVVVFIGIIIGVIVIIAAFGDLRVAVRHKSIYNGLVPRHRGKVVQP
jgi:hypothetical protein